jgi:hypothetical protein
MYLYIPTAAKFTKAQNPFGFVQKWEKKKWHEAKLKHKSF